MTSTGLLSKAKIHYTSFPVTRPTNWRGQKSVVSVVSCRFPYMYSITTTCCGLVGRVANKSVTSPQLPRLRGSYGETCVMDFWHYSANYRRACLSRFSAQLHCFFLDQELIPHHYILVLLLFLFLFLLGLRTSKGLKASIWRL